MHSKTRLVSLILIAYCLSSLKIFAQNVLISNQNNPNEPSIIINPKHPNILIAGANLNNFYVSIDTGHTWVESTLNSSHGVWGDPMMAIDTANDFYFFHLSNPSSGHWIDRIVCQKSSDTGKLWSDGSFTGLNGSKMQDKQWCAIDRKNNNLYLTWTQFDDYGNPNPSDSSIILFSKSTDAGASWSTPRRINAKAGDCLDLDNTVEGAVPTVGPNGEIYVSWAGPEGLVFNKSTDEGNTWLKKEIHIDSMPSGWDYDIPGIYRGNGLPITVCDNSNGPNKGTIYVNWSDQRNGASNTDIWLSKSTDAGKTWSKARRVNNDTSKRHQFFTWMTIDQSTGILYFVFYDRRNHNNDSTDVFLAWSVDGGKSFNNRLISESPFLPDPNIFFGDYTNITAHNGIVRPIWTRLNNGALSLWTDIISMKDTLQYSSIKKMRKADLSFENYPNPASDYTFISFKLHESSKVNLSITDYQGKCVATLINNEERGYGKYIERIDLLQLKLSNGIYFVKLEINHEVQILRQIKL